MSEFTMEIKKAVQDAIVAANKGEELEIRDVDGNVVAQVNPLDLIRKAVESGWVDKETGAFAKAVDEEKFLDNVNKVRNALINKPSDLFGGDVYKDKKQYSEGSPLELARAAGIGVTRATVGSEYAAAPFIAAMGEIRQQLGMEPNTPFSETFNNAMRAVTEVNQEALKQYPDVAMAAELGMSFTPYSIVGKTANIKRLKSVGKYGDDVVMAAKELPFLKKLSYNIYGRPIRSVPLAAGFGGQTAAKGTFENIIPTAATGGDVNQAIGETAIDTAKTAASVPLFDLGAGSVGWASGKGADALGWIAKKVLPALGDDVATRVYIKERQLIKDAFKDKDNFLAQESIKASQAISSKLKTLLNEKDELLNLANPISMNKYITRFKRLRKSIGEPASTTEKQLAKKIDDYITMWSEKAPGAGDKTVARMLPARRVDGIRDEFAGLSKHELKNLKKRPDIQKQSAEIEKSLIDDIATATENPTYYQKVNSDISTIADVQKNLRLNRMKGAEMADADGKVLGDVDRINNIILPPERLKDLARRTRGVVKRGEQKYTGKKLKDTGRKAVEDSHDLYRLESVLGSDVSDSVRRIHTMDVLASEKFGKRVWQFIKLHGGASVVGGLMGYSGTGTIHGAMAGMALGGVAASKGTARIGLTGRGLVEKGKKKVTTLLDKPAISKAKSKVNTKDIYSKTKGYVATKIAEGE